MTGLYLHIPFCRKACTYCDFHFSTSLGRRDKVLAAMRTEITQRRAELSGQPLGTVYFGGGTPSLLSADELTELFAALREVATVTPGAEITLEANPDDVDKARLEQWLAAGITRISLGVQSFREDRLRWIGRAHNAQQSLAAIGLIAKAPLVSWTIDLIYGLPHMAMAEWDEQLRIALDHGMPHLSAYALTVEERTALHKQVVSGAVVPSADADQVAQFERTIERMEAAGLEQYEISNFGRPGHYAMHNSNYWKGVPYVGIGPSAHSFSGSTRRWNVASNGRYVQAMASGDTYWEQESLSAAQRTNEMLLTGLRTKWGVALDELPVDIRLTERAVLDRHVGSGDLVLADGRLFLTRKGRSFADRIASDLFTGT